MTVGLLAEHMRSLNMENHKRYLITFRTTLNAMDRYPYTSMLVLYKNPLQCYSTQYQKYHKEQIQ